MRKLFFLLCLLLGATAFAQKTDKKFEELQQQIATQRATLDSSRKVTDSLMLVSNKRRDSIDMARYMEQNTSNLVSYMQERERKQKKGMWLRIGAGLMFLVIGIVGIMRKRKPKTGNTGSSGQA